MVVFSNDTRCAIQQYTSQGGIHIRGDILLQTSCFIDHMLQGFSRLCLQISCAAPDGYLETPRAKGDTDIYPLSSPFLPAPQNTHSTLCLANMFPLPLPLPPSDSQYFCVHQKSSRVTAGCCSSAMHRVNCSAQSPLSRV